MHLQLHDHVRFQVDEKTAENRMMSVQLSRLREVKRDFRRVYDNGGMFTNYSALCSDLLKSIDKALDN